MRQVVLQLRTILGNSRRILFSVANLGHARTDTLSGAAQHGFVALTLRAGLHVKIEGICSCIAMLQGFEIRSLHRPKFSTGKKGWDARLMPRYRALIKRLDQSLQFRTLSHAKV